MLLTACKFGPIFPSLTHDLHDPSCQLCALWIQMLREVLPDAESRLTQAEHDKSTETIQP